MRALVCGLLVVTLPATLMACAVDATSTVSDENREIVDHGTSSSNGASGGESTPPVQNDPTQPVGLPKLQAHKTASVPGVGDGTTSTPVPEPWRGGHPGSGGGASGTQKKDGPLHTTIRDMIEPPDDGHNP